MIFSIISFFGFAILISFILQFVGIVWYGPLFGRYYICVAHPNKQLIAPSFVTYILCFLYSLLSVCIIGLVILTGFAPTFFDTIIFSSIISLLIGLFNSIHYLFDDRPLKLNILHSGYNFVLVSISSFSWYWIGPLILPYSHL